MTTPWYARPTLASMSRRGFLLLGAGAATDRLPDRLRGR